MFQARQQDEQVKAKTHLNTLTGAKYAVFSELNVVFRDVQALENKSF